MQFVLYCCPLGKVHRRGITHAGETSLPAGWRPWMKITDTIETVLRNKTINKILPVNPGQTVREALELMASHDVGALMVMEDGRLVGILSERDYARKGILKDHHSENTRVREIMSSHVIAITPEFTVEDCMNLMTERHFRHLPVVRGDEVVGIVSIGDLVKWVIKGQEHAIESLKEYIAGAYPA